MRRPASLLLLVFLFACGASARTKSLQSTLVAVNVVRDTFLAVSAKREDQIVEAATSKEEGRAKLDAFRQATIPIVSAIGNAYRAIAAASLLSDSASVGEAAGAAAKAATLVKELGQ